MSQSTLLDKIRHSATHVLAMAVLRIYPEAKLGVGSATEEGFFHDFELPVQVSQSDLERIENEMRNIVREKIPLTQMFLPQEIAINTLLQRGQIYKVELIREAADEEICFAKAGPEFIDPCRRSHINNTEDLLAFKLTNLSGAYWKGDEKRPQLQRISGIAMRTPEELEQYFHQQEVLEQLDFRKLGRELEYLTTEGQQIILTPLGQDIYSQLLDKVWSELVEADYQEVSFPVIEERSDLNIKTLFELKNRSYKELPLKWASYSIVNPKQQLKIGKRSIRGARKIVLAALCTEDHFAIELTQQIDVLLKAYKKLDIDISIDIVASDIENSIVESLSEFLEKNLVSHAQIIDPEMTGVLVKLKTTDQHSREWVLAKTEILHPAMTQYSNRTGELVPTINIISQTVLDNLFAYYLEHTEGELPTWLSPRKCIVISIGESFNDYAQKVRDQVAEEYDLPVELDVRSEKMEAKIRDAELKKYPLILVVGGKEEKNQTVSVRLRGNNEIGMVKLTEIGRLLER